MLKKWLSVIMAVIIGGSIFLHHAQAEGEYRAEDFPYKELSIQVMPEFDYPEGWPEDKPSLLNAFYGTITNNSGQDYSGELEFPVPLSDKDFQVYLVAEFPADNQSEVQRPYELNKAKNTLIWKPAEVIKQGSSYQFVIEYYSNPIAVTDTEKKFDFQFIPEASVEKLDIIFYNPMNSTEFTLDPKAQNVTGTDYGQELHLYQYTDVLKGEPVSYSTSYKKEGNESTLSIISKQTPEDGTHAGLTATDQVGNNGLSTSENQPIIGTAGAFIIGLSICIAGAFVFFGLRGAKESKYSSNVSSNGRNTSKKGARTSSASVKSLDEEKKLLRNKLMTGKIDEKTYEERMKKLI
ncbi:hypothetical protein SAMN05192533_106263 [Mesobacillus persicus]|uniref:Uncharacterized protein n=1 Tax=Mesobacillus persicus TaxID=930146 RepID=A0A1H8C2A4_9BACI|nr:hypothetical protein [Mesobacillus persicus]SEM89193.1 hypothetical protein SAMN05192533_106263 [Mesobacillus persicus]